MTSHEFEIANLAECLDLIATVAQWHWGHGFPDRTLSTTVEWVRARANLASIPLTFVAVANDVPLGAVTVDNQDRDAHVGLSPWLVGVSTHPDRPRKGVCSALVQHAVTAAAELGVTHLYLDTDTNGAAWSLYERPGWETYAEEISQNVPVVVMMIETELGWAQTTP